MARNLPSLNQLRAFEAAARHESIKDGAEELCVTPAAVGHHIKALERNLNISLFHRQIRKITLTTIGRELATKVGGALDDLESAVAAIALKGARRTLKITVAPFFGNRWLLPRLAKFADANREIQIESIPSFDYVDLLRSDFDAAVRFGDGRGPGLESIQIYCDCISPVCAPQLVEAYNLPLPPEQVVKLPLACANRWQGDWEAWAAAAGIPLSRDIDCVEYDSRAFMFDAALSGKAVILADQRLTAADEAAGRLVKINPLSVTRPQGIHLVFDRRRMLDPDIATFAQWLREEAILPEHEIAE